MAMGIGVGAWLVLRQLFSCAEPKRVEPKPQRIVVIGDSLGLGLAPALAKISSIEVVGIAESGTRIRQWAQRVDSIQELCDVPSLVLISLGTNDAVMGRDQIAAEAGDVQALAEALCRFSDPVWLLPPPHLEVKHLVEATGLIVDNAPDCCTLYGSQPDIELGPDRIHPTGRGYAQWADHVWKFLGGDRG